MPLCRRVLGLAASFGFAGFCCGQSYLVTIDETASGLSGSIAFSVETSGTLIGDWDPDTNPDGTRTKPGLFGPFESTENVPVAVELGLSLVGPLETSTAGSFVLRLDLDGAELTVEGYVADLLADGPAAIPATLSFFPESFRTRNPDSTYFGVPIDLPIGNLAITAMSVVQTDGAATGVLTQTGPDEYDFAVVIPAVLDAEFELLGTPFPVEGLPFPVTLAGTLTVSEGGVTIAASQPVEFEEVQEPGQDLPQFPLDVPTIFPPGETAHLLMDLTLDTVSSSMMGAITLSATGEPASCPGDCNGDTIINTQDFLCFLNLYVAGDPAADCNGDTVINTQDFLCFLNAWVEGC